MKEPNRERKADIKSINAIQLNEEQKEAKRLIIENQIVIITGRAGCGKSLVCAQASLDFLKKKQVDCVYNTRAAIEVGRSLGFLPGSVGEKFDPYMEAFIENLNKCCSDKKEVDKLIEDDKIKALPVQFIRGKTIDDVLIVEEAQNLTKAEMLAIITRLGKTGKIIINGDNEQKDIKDEFNGLSYAIELSKKIKEIKWIKLKVNHRSDLVGKILDYEYGK
jgi:phosphate starvation-inducible protein PhoH|tara:strand:- start:282 stop:941 length:660 start_codon:yes stop_codon:yes gene_type:complete